ncbi:MAG TPA: hypothetical protein VG826_27590 [Pirellulales bacterium]|nr:hypothetical protein [Pirellulales bacterium]
MSYPYSRRLLPHITDDGRRIFAESCGLPELNKAIKRMDGLAAVVVENHGPWEWKIRFSDQGRNFEIERQSNGVGAYFVDDRWCPDDILLAMVESLDERLGDPPLPDVSFWRTPFVVAMVILVVVAFVVGLVIAVATA